MDYGREALAEHLAADYVAGTLRGPARRRFVALLPAHPRLRAAVRAWEARLMPITGVVAPVAPSPEVWKRIEARLAGGAVAAPAAPASPRASGAWANLAFWRGFAALATVATLTLGVLLAQPPAAQVPMVVVLNAAGGSGGSGGVTPASFVASISGDGRAVVTRPIVPVAVQADRALELWALPKTGAPRSLGVISHDNATIVRDRRVLGDTTGLAVTVEPPGGSPSGAPTGPIVYVGTL